MPPGFCHTCRPLAASHAVTMPLVHDTYTTFTIAHRNSLFLVDSMRLLDGTGHGAATLNLPPGLSPSLIGLTVFHAYVVLDVPGTGATLFASNAFPLTLVP